MNDGFGLIFVGLVDVIGGDEIVVVFDKVIVEGLCLLYVNFDKGIMNFYVLSDVIVDVFMLVFVCNGGKLWGKDGEEVDILVVIFDLFYVSVY